MFITYLFKISHIKFIFNLDNNIFMHNIMDKCIKSTIKQIKVYHKEYKMT
jgi:hypothetical protein